MSKLRGLLLIVLWSLVLPQVRCSVRLVLVLLPVVVIIPPLIFLIISASSVVVVPPILVVIATLIVPLVGAVIKVVSGCHHVVFLLELRAFISVMAVISTNSANSLWN